MEREVMMKLRNTVVLLILVLFPFTATADTDQWGLPGGTSGTPFIFLHLI